MLQSRWIAARSCISLILLAAALCMECGPPVWISSPLPFALAEHDIEAPVDIADSTGGHDTVPPLAALDAAPVSLLSAPADSAVVDPWSDSPWQRALRSMPSSTGEFGLWCDRCLLQPGIFLKKFEKKKECGHRRPCALGSSLTVAIGRSWRAAASWDRATLTPAIWSRPGSQSADEPLSPSLTRTESTLSLGV